MKKPDLVIVVVVEQNLPIAVSVCSLEALPAEPVDLLVALRSSVSHLRSEAQEQILDEGEIQDC